MAQSTLRAMLGLLDRQIDEILATLTRRRIATERVANVARARRQPLFFGSFPRSLPNRHDEMTRTAIRRHLST
jgi:hypothetical protein